MANDRPASPELVERRIAETVDGLGLPTPTESELPLVDAVGGLQYAQLGTAGIADDAITSAKIALGAIQNLDVATNAGILVTKLAPGTAGQILQSNATPAPAWTTVTGDVTISNTGVTAIGANVVVDGDIATNANIAHTKLANITAGSVLMGNASNVPTATALTGDVTVNSSGVTAISAGAVVKADLSTTTGEIAGAWSSDTVNTGFTNVTGGNASRRWLIIGKTMHFRMWFTAGTATAASFVEIPLPASASMQNARATFYNAANGTTVVSSFTPAGTPTLVRVTNSTAAGNFTAGATLVNLQVNGTLEIA